MRRSSYVADRDAYLRTQKSHPPLVCKPGERVCLTRYHLICLNTSLTDPAWFQEGAIVELPEHLPEHARVLWDREKEAVLVHRGNLAHLGANLRRCE